MDQITSLILNLIQREVVSLVLVRYSIKISQQVILLVWNVEDMGLAIIDRLLILLLFLLLLLIVRRLIANVQKVGHDRLGVLAGDAGGKISLVTLGGNSCAGLRADLLHSATTVASMRHEQSRVVER